MPAIRSPFTVRYSENRVGIDIDLCNNDSRSRVRSNHRQRFASEILSCFLTHRIANRWFLVKRGGMYAPQRVLWSTLANSIISIICDRASTIVKQFSPLRNFIQPLCPPCVNRLLIIIIFILPWSFGVHHFMLLPPYFVQQHATHEHLVITIWYITQSRRILLL